MQLKEFIDKNGNQVKIPKSGNTSSVGTGNTSGQNFSMGFKKRFEKLMDYATKHRYSKINKVEITKITEDTLEFAEYYDGGAIVDYKIYIGPATEAWHIEAFTTILNAKDREKVDDLVGTGWVELLKSFRPYITIPVVGTPEYKNLLTEELKEFVDAKGNKVNLNRTSSNAPATTKTNKEKFEELVAYMDRYKDIYTTKTDAEWIKDTGFKYVMTRKSPGVKEYTITLELTYSRFNSSWQFETYRNYDYVEDDAGQGWKELLKALSRSEFGLYTTIPAYGSKEYDSLCESAVSSLAEDFKIYENLWD